ncbi:MAG TPA: hypothetical protein VJQ25_10980 [Nitrospira sp.]|nr:hypothetical protein [Nitrospira sp.]
MTEGLVDSIELGELPKRGRGRPRHDGTGRGHLPDLLPPLTATPDSPATIQSLLSIRHSHHHLAQLIAAGNLTMGEISQITGYCISRISVLKADPLFKQLLATYSENRKAIFVDAMERMKTLGLSTLDELQKRLEDEPEKFSRRELMEMSKLLLVDSRKSVESNSSITSNTAVALNVKFISPPVGTGVRDGSPANSPQISANSPQLEPPVLDLIELGESP